MVILKRMLTKPQSVNDSLSVMNWANVILGGVKRSRVFLWY